MDGEQFDLWTRSLDTRRPRRWLLRGFVGGLVIAAFGRERHAEAVHDRFPTHGEPCRPGIDTCVYASGGFACDYVGWTDDFRCCAYQGDRCGWHDECCGDSFCFDGICRAAVGGSGTSSGGACTWAGCSCLLWRVPECRASCQLNDPCDPGLSCTGTSEDIGTCVPF